MSVQLDPYLGFRAGAREAMEFYHRVFGGQLTMNTFAELNAAQDPSENDLVMHAQLEGDHGITFMASDIPTRMEHTVGSNFSMALSGDDAELLSGWFEQLADGGRVTMPLEQAVWGDSFGMLVDRFGINWLVNISAGRPPA